MWWSGKQFFLWKESKNPFISLCRSLKTSGNKKIQKCLILTSVKIWETIFFEKIQKSLNSIVWKFEKFRKYKNPKILDLHKYENPWNKFFFEKIQKSLNPIVLKLENFTKKIQKSLIITSMKIWERNSFLKKSKNPWFCKML